MTEGYKVNARMKGGSRLILAFAGVLPAFFLAAPVKAASLVNLQILGSTDGGATYKSSLIVTPGESVMIEVVGQLAPVGTSNTQGATQRTVTSYTASDGLSSLKFNLADAGGGAFSNLALNSVWTGGTGASAGTVSGETVTAIRPIINGVVNATTSGPTQIVTGTYTVPTLPLVSDSITGSWTTAGTGGFKYNGGTSVAMTSSTETGTDPIVSYAPLSLNTIPSPEPATLGLLAGASALGLLTRRRRVAK